MNITSKPGTLPLLSQPQQSPASPKPALGAAASPPAPVAQNPARPQDSFEAAPAQRRWNDFTPVIRQHQRDNCGAAVAAMLARSMGTAPRQTNEQLMNRLESRFTDGKGTTPAQMGTMLADQGIEVLGSKARFSRSSIEQALSAGMKIVAMVDSNLISPKHPQKPGNPHWVVIDGFDGENSFRIKDPGRGTGYWIQTRRLTEAMNSGRKTFDGGGMMMIRTASTQADPATLAERNATYATKLGTKPGIGSNTSALGRESSS